MAGTHSQSSGEPGGVREERQWLKELLREHGLTQEEFAKKVGVSRELVTNWISGYRRPSLKHLRRIAEVLGVSEKVLFIKEGLFSKDFFEVSPEVVLVPLLSDNIPCGTPKECFDEYIEDFQPIFREMLEMAVGKAYEQGLRVYFLRVEGDAMIEAGIVPGGFILFSPDLEVQSGDVALLEVKEEGLTVREVFFEGNVVVLVPKNNHYAPRILEAKEVAVKGKALFSLNFICGSSEERQT